MQVAVVASEPRFSGVSRNVNDENYVPRIRLAQQTSVEVLLPSSKWMRVWSFSGSVEGNERPDERRIFSTDFGVVVVQSLVIVTTIDDSFFKSFQIGSFALVANDRFWVSEFVKVA